MGIPSLGQRALRPQAYFKWTPPTPRIRIGELPSAIQNEPTSRSFAARWTTDDVGATPLKRHAITLPGADVIYLPLAVHSEENARAKGPEGKFVPSLHLDPWQDEWKR